MNPSEWVLKNCRFAADWQGPLPRSSYYHEQENPYGELLPKGTKYDPETQELVFEPGWRQKPVTMKLGPEQAKELVSEMERRLRREYIENSLPGDAIEKVALGEAAKHGLSEDAAGVDWDFQEDDDGIEVYTLVPKRKTLFFVSNREIWDKYHLMRPEMLDEPSAPEKPWDQEA